jgi:hypothetical protein
MPGLCQTADALLAAILADPSEGLSAGSLSLLDAVCAGPLQYASWHHYEGPRGGVGWENEHGDVVYGGDAPPGERGGKRAEEEFRGGAPAAAGPGGVRVALARVGEMGMKAFEGVNHVQSQLDKVAVEFGEVKPLIAELPEKYRPMVAGVWWATKLATKAALATYLLTERAAERVALSRGASKAVAKAIRAFATAIDVVGLRVVPIILQAHGVSPLASLAGSLVPVGSAAYLAYAVAPLAVQLAGRALRAVKAYASDVKAAFGFAEPPGMTMGAEETGLQLQHARKAKGEDAALDAALDAVLHRFAEGVEKHGEWFAALAFAALSVSETVDDALDMAAEIVQEEGPQGQYLRGHPLQFAWNPYHGPRGGEGWQNEQGDIVYGSTPPGERGGGKADEARGFKSGLRKIARLGGKAFAGLGYAEHQVQQVAGGFSKFVAPQVEKLPPKLRATVKGMWWLTKLGLKTWFSTYIAGERASEAVARRLGLSDKAALAVRGLATGMDVFGAKAVPLSLELAGFGFWPAMGASMIPVGSAAYLAYATAPGAVRLARRALREVRDAARDMKEVGKAVFEESPLGYARLAGQEEDGRAGALEEVLERFARGAQKYGQWYEALAFAALSVTKSAGLALDLAERLVKEGGRKRYARRPGEPHDYGTAMLMLPEPLSRKLLELVAQIDPEDLAEEPDGEHHITALHGLHDDDPLPLHHAVHGMGPVRIKLGPLSTFPPSGHTGGKEVLKVEVQGDDVHKLRDALAGVTAHTDHFPEGFRPHITLAYLHPGRGGHYTGSHPLEGTEVVLDHLTLSDRLGETVDIPLREEEIPDDEEEDEESGKHARDRQGGEVPAELDVAKAADLVTFPEAVEGASCGNCMYGPGSAGGPCKHPRLDGTHVNDRMCCSLWDKPGTLRAWGEMPGAGAEPLQHAREGFLLQYQWEQDKPMGTSKTGLALHKWVWKGAGEKKRPRIQHREPGTGRAPREAGWEGPPRPQKPKAPTLQEVATSLASLNRKDVTQDHVKAVTTALLSKTKAQMHQLRENLRLDVRGLKSATKDKLAQRLIDHVRGFHALAPTGKGAPSAAQEGLQQRGGVGEHQGDDQVRPPAEAGRGGQPQEGGQVQQAQGQKVDPWERAKALPAPEKLPEDPGQYFNRPSGTIDVPLSQLRATRARPEGIANAGRYMEAARQGILGKRDPIKVVKQPDGSYLVADGNSTFANAEKSGWKSMPVQEVSPEWMEEERQRTVAKEDQKARQKLASARLFTPEEQALPQERPSLARSEEDAYAHAERAMPGFQEILDRGKGLSARLGGHVVTDFQKALGEMESTPGPFVIIAPLKGKERAREKVGAWFGNDWGRMNDLVRATVAVDGPDDVAKAVEGLKAEMGAHGWTVNQKPTNRFENPLPSGYRDMSVTVRSPEGMTAEVQINTKAMIRAKEGPGHKLYERARAIEGKAAVEKRKMTDEETAEFERLQGEMAGHYNGAWHKGLGVEGAKPAAGAQAGAGAAEGAGGGVLPPGPGAAAPAPGAGGAPGGHAGGRDVGTLERPQAAVGGGPAGERAGVRGGGQGVAPAGPPPAAGPAGPAGPAGGAGGRPAPVGSPQEEAGLRDYLEKEFKKLGPGTGGWFEGTYRSWATKKAKEYREKQAAAARAAPKPAPAPAPAPARPAPAAAAGGERMAPAAPRGPAVPPAPAAEGTYGVRPPEVTPPPRAPAAPRQARAPLADRLARIQEREKQGRAPFADMLIAKLKEDRLAPEGTKPSDVIGDLKRLARGDAPKYLPQHLRQDPAALDKALKALGPDFGQLSAKELYDIAPRMTYPEQAGQGVAGREVIQQRYLPANIGETVAARERPAATTRPGAVPVPARPERPPQPEPQRQTQLPLADRLAMMQEREKEGKAPFADMLITRLKDDKLVPKDMQPAEVIAELKRWAGGKQTTTQGLATRANKEKLARALQALGPDFGRLSTSELFKILPHMSYPEQAGQGVAGREVIGRRYLPTDLGKRIGLAQHGRERLATRYARLAGGALGRGDPASARIYARQAVDEHAREVLRYAAHDVSGEPRDETGKWTTGGGGGKATREKGGAKEAPARPPEKPPARIKSQVRVAGASMKEAQQMIGRLFPGSDDPDQALADAIGAPDGSQVVIGEIGRYRPLYADDRLLDAEGMRVSIHHAKLGLNNYFVGIRPNGKRLIRNELIQIREGSKGQGLGTEMFARQVETAVASGFDEINLHAAGGPGEGMNGYYTWPRFGFDQEIEPLQWTNAALYRRVRYRFTGVERVSDIMRTPAGRDWWRMNGGELHDARFDLRQGSYSRKVLDAYLAERKAKKGA